MPEEQQTRLGLEHFPTRKECVLAEILAAGAVSTPDKTFVVFPDGEWSYEETAGRAWQMANALIALGVEPGEHVSAWMPSGQPLLQTWFGTNAAGAVYAPINPAARASLLAHRPNLAGLGCWSPIRSLPSGWSGSSCPTWRR